MNDHTAIGPMLACALGDAYGAGFEYARGKVVKAHNDLSGYIQHQKWTEMKPGNYTDDTQMALAIAEHMIAGSDWNPSLLADAWVEGFHRDKRAGYAGGFYKFLCETTSAHEFLDNIRPGSNKSGGAMRAFPVGLLPDIEQVRDLAMFQASLTHATHDGMYAAAAAALMFHHRYHRLGPKADLPAFLTKWLPGVYLDVAWKGKVNAPGLECVRAALTAFMLHNNMADVLKQCIAWTGDVDTVAAICMPTAAVCQETGNGLPQVLIDGLENGDYGRDYLIDIDHQLRAEYPRVSERDEDLEARRAAKRAARAKTVTPPDDGDDGDDEPGPLDFLFDD
jgi:ADP-ribosyl-[dinitrogen reductase] hydrolase